MESEREDDDSQEVSLSVMILLCRFVFSGWLRESCFSLSYDLLPDEYIEKQNVEKSWKTNGKCLNELGIFLHLAFRFS